MPPRSRQPGRAAKLALRALPGFQGDIDALPDYATRKMALDMLVLVRDGKVRGYPLDDRVSTGDLGDCYKLYFDPDGSGKPRFRLVYRYSPTEVAAVAVEAVAVGRRAELDAYLRARANLDGAPDAADRRRATEVPDSPPPPRNPDR